MWTVLSMEQWDCTAVRRERVLSTARSSPSPWYPIAPQFSFLLQDLYVYHHPWRIVKIWTHTILHTLLNRASPLLVTHHIHWRHLQGGCFALAREGGCWRWGERWILASPEPSVAFIPNPPKPFFSPHITHFQSLTLNWERSQSKPAPQACFSAAFQSQPNAPWENP